MFLSGGWIRKGLYGALLLINILNYVTFNWLLFVAYEVAKHLQEIFVLTT